MNRFTFHLPVSEVSFYTRRRRLAFDFCNSLVFLRCVRERLKRRSLPPGSTSCSFIHSLRVSPDLAHASLCSTFSSSIGVGDSSESLPHSNSPRREILRMRGATFAAFWASISLRSSRKKWVQRMDSNHRPLGYEPNALPDCATLQNSMNVLVKPTMIS